MEEYMEKVNKKGFTMVEILVTVAIIAVLAGIAIPLVTSYIQNGKNEYNEKLKDQLLISGKEYFTDNRQKLPVKYYTGIYKDGKDYSYVSLPEMQSNNYVSKEFIDADGNECSESYVYVRPDEDKNSEYEWHACLRCTNKEGKVLNYSDNDAVCNIIDWDDTERPTCDQATYEGGKQGAITGKRYNPTSIKLKGISDNKKISNIIIKNITTEEEITVGAKDKDSDTMNMNLREYIENSEYFKRKEGEYRITIVDNGGHISDSCANFVIKTSKPTCELSYPNPPKSKEEKKITIDVKDKISEEKDLSYTIKDKSDYTIQQREKLKEYSLSGKKDGTYYGYVMDEIGQTNTCKKDIKITMFKDENAYCTFLTKDDGKWYGGTLKKKTEQVECYVYKGNQATMNQNKLKSNKGLGTLTPRISSKTNNNTGNKVIYDIDYTTKSSVSGTDNVVLEEGFFSALDTGKSNNRVEGPNIKVDAIAPSMSLINPKNGVWSKDNVTITGEATDAGGSGVKVYYSTDNKTYKEKTTGFTTNLPTNKTYTEAKSSTQTYYAKAIDGAGNISATISTSIKIDKKAPTITLTNSSGGKWTKKTVTLTITGKDSESGIAKLEYKNGAASYITKTSGFDSKTTDNKKITWTPNASTDRDTTFYVRITDKAGNVSKVAQTPVRIDTKPPKITYTANRSKVSGKSFYPASSSKPFKATIKCTDSGGSGISTFTHDTNLTSPHSQVHDHTYKLTGPHENFKLAGTCKDKAGNTKSNDYTYKVAVYSENSSCDCKTWKYKTSCNTDTIYSDCNVRQVLTTPNCRAGWKYVRDGVSNCTSAAHPNSNPALWVRYYVVCQKCTKVKDGCSKRYKCYHY